MKQYIALITVFCMSMSTGVVAQTATSKNDAELKARIGYSIGGTAPIGIPATIRSIDAFRLTPSVTAGIDATFPIKNSWGITSGLHIENKAMDADITTKGYRMEVTKGDSKIDGLFTGHVKQKVTQWMLTIPLEATFDISNKVSIKAGPYFSLLVNKDFSGIAYDGYLRQGSPTGPRINMGTKEGEWATYEFNDDMRSLQAGIAAGADWQTSRNIGLYAELSWGLTGLFNKDFKTVEQTLYPIYGTIGIFYKFTKK